MSLSKSEVAEEVVTLNDENSECEVENACRTSVSEETVEEDIESNEMEINDVARDPVEEKPTNEQVKNTVAEHPASVVVFATAVIENSQEKSLSVPEMKNLKNLIFREKHLQDNILKLEYGQNFAREIRKNNFKHTIELILYVSTRNLWDGARSYVWRHFGQNEWRKPNGSSVVFNKIHVKSSA